jgi:aminopeptidase YwaD
VELLVFNGEDYYSAPGEMDYVNKNQGRFGEVTVAVNMDGAGYCKGPTAFSFYGCPPVLEAGLRQAFASQPGIEEGPAWYQSDHSVFIQQGRPAVALTSAVFLDEITVHITHTPRDRPELVAVEKLTALARALAEFIDQATA